MKIKSEGCQSAVSVNKIILTAPKNGEAVDVLNREISTFLNGYETGLSARLPYKENSYDPIPVRFEWSAPEETEEFLFTFSDNFGLTGGMSYRIVKPYFTLHIPFRANRIYWKVSCFIDGAFFESETFYFLLEKIPAAVLLQGVSNTRDIGGYKGMGGKTVGRGLVYRGGNLDGITEEGKRIAEDVLKIRAVLDLRRAGEGTASEEFSPLGKKVKHVNEWGCMYTLCDFGDCANIGKEGINVPEGAAELVRELLFFADKGHFPAYVHCVLGRDRTGTLMIFLLGICGVCKRDIMLDYELSFFSETGRNKDTDVSKILGYAESIFTYVDTFEGNTLQEKMTDLLLKAGMSGKQITEIQNNLLAEGFDEM